VGRRIPTASGISGMRCGSHVEKVANMSVCPFLTLNLFPVVFVEILVPWLTLHSVFLYDSIHSCFIVSPSSSDARTYRWPFVSQAQRGHKCGQGAERSTAPAGRVLSVPPPLPRRLLTGLCGRACAEASVAALPLGPRPSRWGVSCRLSLDFSRQTWNCSAYATTCAIIDERYSAGLGPCLQRTRLSSLSGCIALVGMTWMLRLPAWPTCARSGSMQNVHLTSPSGGNS
jgi:hypothetical protein